MSKLQTLTHAATLKGYLLAMDAPSEMIALAQGIVDAEVSILAQPVIERVANEDVRLPAPTELFPDLPSLDEGPPAVLPRPLLKDEVEATPETAIAAPETALPEENSEPEAAEDAEPVAVPTAGKRKAGIQAKLTAGDLPAVMDALATKTFAQTAHEFGVTGQTIRNFLARHNVDRKQFRKRVHSKWLDNPNPGKYMAKAHESAQEVDRDGWPMPVKPSKCSEFGTKIRSPREEAIAELLAALPPANDKAGSKLTRDDVPRILQLLGDIEMKSVSERYGVQWGQVDALLQKYGIDYRVLPPKSSPRIELPATEPMMKFKTVAIRDTWGNENEIQVPEPLSVEKDPETGATVTKYPPGYAYNAGPQKNVGVRGGA